MNHLPLLAQEQNDRFLPWLKILLPLLSVTVYLADCVWQLYKPITNYAGFAASLLMIFFFFSFNHGINPTTTPGTYFSYWMYIFFCVVGGDIIYMTLCWRNDGGADFPFFVLVFWVISDAAFIITVACFGMTYKASRLLRDQQNVDLMFLLIARTELIFAIFIPTLASNGDHVFTSNIIGLFLLFEVLTHSYYMMEFELRLVFWIFSLSSLFASLFEWLHLSYKHAVVIPGDNDLYLSLSWTFEFIAGVCAYWIIIKSLYDPRVRSRHSSVSSQFTAPENALQLQVQEHLLPLGNEEV